jgi:hypothetical protein
LVGVGGVDELDPLAWKIKGNLRHSCSLDGQPGPHAKRYAALA